MKFWSQSQPVHRLGQAARSFQPPEPVCRQRATVRAAQHGPGRTFINDWDAKFTYATGAVGDPNGDQDGNDATERDASWTSLNAVPMHPEYPSQAGIIAGASIGVLEAVFGPKPATAITVTDVMDPKLQRRFDNVQQIAEQVQDVRVWGGIHFRNSLQVGYDMGQKIAAYLVANSLKPTN